MHFHGDRAGRLQKYDFGVRLHVLHNIGANQRIEPAGGHAELAENFGAEILTGFIGGIGHQHMIALLHKSEDGVGNGSRTTREQGATRAAFQFAHRFLQRNASGFRDVHRKAHRWHGCVWPAFGLHGVKHQRRSALDHAIYRAQRVFLLRPA